ncbi:syndecan-2 [Neolamprologus brichardi]|uniref:Syndecan n=1 Tax=Neolamprologus brichardi TaxID=32507 RepID=A0A3Q4H5R3_NEOBR|nr:syndecan-2 [Neolamprologus brichardi]
MRNVWIILTLGLVVFLAGKTIAQAPKISSQADDLYLDDTGSGGYYPEDDDDFNSGSGSGGGEEAIEESVTVTMVYIEPSVGQPTQDSTKDFTPRMDTDPVREKSGKSIPRKPFTTKAPVPDTEDTQRTSTTSTPGSPPNPVEVHTENLFQRTEVLAAVIAGGVIGFLFAIFLILLLVYRMRKKDEGSYDLGERKPSGAAYQKAPTKEFYA